MKLITSRSSLATTIGKIQGIVPKKPAIPILANILLEARDGCISIAATDLTVGMCAQIEATVTQPGAITLPARLFFKLIRELTSADVEIEAVAEETAVIRTGSAHFRLCGMHKSEFPALSNLAQAKSFKLPAHILREMFTHSTFAAAREDSRQMLNGVLMRLVGKEAIFVGTDGKRLAKLSTLIAIEEEYHHDYVIPLKAVEEIIKLLDEEEEVTVRLLPDKIGIETASAFIITQLISDDFPDVDRIIPTAPPLAIKLHREELMTLLRQISLFTPDKGHSVLFTFHDKELKLGATSKDIGEGEVSMPVDYTGDKLEIAFNPLFFHDILRHCREEVISLALTDPYNPGLITDAMNSKFVLMPMRLQSPVA
ncbi:MAG: DNA polymerase III subunit beta [Chlamydiota bacterium]